MSQIEDAHIDIRSVHQLLSPSDETEPAWLIENLIREGDQVVLAGAPKSGKSFFAFQLAMAVAQGRNHLGEGWFLLPEFGLPRQVKRKVIFFSLEMGPSVVRSRLRPWKRLSNETDVPFEAMEDLKFVFSIGGRSTLDLGDSRGDVYKSVQQLVSDEKPHLVVFDTFVRVHGFDENDNVRMASLMQNLLDLCEIPDEARPGQTRRIAHLIIHHLRKPGKEHHWNGSVIDAVRGAGSIIGAADLILGMAVDRSNRRKLEFCCRHLPQMDDIDLDSHEVPPRDDPDRKLRHDSMVLFSQAPKKPEPERPVGRKLRAPTQRAVDEVKNILETNFKEAEPGAKVTVQEALGMLPDDVDVNGGTLCEHGKAVHAKGWIYRGKKGSKSQTKCWWERESSDS
jgi:hypothetical protein